MSGFIISQITKNGIGSIKGMLAPEVAEAIEKDLPATALAVVEDDTAIGALGGAVNGDTFEVVSVYVEPGSRRKGAGTALMKEIFSLAEAENLSVRVEYTPINSEGKTLKPFFTAMGFMQEEVIFPVYCIDSLENFKLDPRSLSGSMAEIFSFREAPENLLSTTELLNGEGPEAGSAITDAVDRSLSFCAVEKGEITACLVTETVSDDIVEITPVREENADIRDVKLMLSYALDEIRKTYSPETSIVIPVFETQTRRIVEDFFGSSAAVTLGFVRSDFTEL